MRAQAHKCALPNAKIPPVPRSEMVTGDDACIVLIVALGLVVISVVVVAFNVCCFNVVVDVIAACTVFIVVDVYVAVAAVILAASY